MLELSEAERHRRWMVWSAMAEVFLDTETRPSVSLLALACLESGYTQTELDEIWRHEVSPVLAPNLLTMAGAWAWGDLAWMEELIVRRHRGILDRLWARVCRSHWREACRLMDWLRGWPEDERSRVAHALFRMTWAAYSDLSAEALNLSGLSEASITKIWTEAAVPLMTNLYVKGHEEPLSTYLKRGQAALDERRS